MFFKKLKTVLLQPGKFFSSFKEETMHDGMSYFLILSFFYNVILVLFNQALGTTVIASQYESLGISLSSSLLYLPLIPILIIIHLFVLLLIAGLSHIFVMMLKGQGGFSNTFNAAVYAHTPVLLLGWIPYANYGLVLYGVFIFIVGISVWHKISRFRALCVFLGPFILAVLLFMLLLFLGLGVGYAILKSRFTGF